MTDKTDSENSKNKNASKGLSQNKPSNTEQPKGLSETSDNSENKTPKPANKIAPDSVQKNAQTEPLFSAAPIPKMSAKKAKTNWLMPSIISLLMITALLVSGWTFYQQSLFNENWSTLQADFKSRIDQQTQSIQQTKSNSQAAVQAANNIQLQLNQFILKNQQLSDSLLSTQEKIKTLSGRKKQDWMLAEVAHLIKLAQLKLTLQKDKLTAIQLLKTADQQIIKIADNQLLPLREAIANDLSELSLIIDTDITGIYLQLNAISLLIPHLEITALEFQPIEKAIASAEQQANDFKWQDIYQNFLKDFVTIKNHSEPVKPLMTADQRGNLNNNIQLAIQQAQIALLQGDEALYQLNIENVIQWSNDYFKHEQKLAEITEQLNQLKSQIIEARYPTKLHAKQTLETISQQQLYHWLEQTQSNLAQPKIESKIKENASKPKTTDLESH